MATCIIPARGGSRRIPRKNLQEFCGKPIISYSIALAMESGLFDRIIVSTDSLDIEKIAVADGVEVHWRNPLYARDSVGTQDVARHVLEDLDIRWGLACVIYATAPLLSVDDLKRVRAALVLKKDLVGRFAYSVGADMRDAGACYWGKIPAFRDEEDLHGFGAWKIVIPNVCDINTMDDWEKAEKMYTELHNA